MGSHRVTCYPTQVNTPRLNPSHTSRYSIYLPRRDGRLSWPSWLDSPPPGRESNLRPFDHESNAELLRHQDNRSWCSWCWSWLRWSKEVSDWCWCNILHAGRRLLDAESWRSACQQSSFTARCSSVRTCLAQSCRLSAVSRSSGHYNQVLPVQTLAKLGRRSRRAGIASYWWLGACSTI